MDEGEHRFVFLETGQACQVLPGEPGDLSLALIIHIGKTGQVKGAQVQDAAIFQAGKALVVKSPAHVPVGVLPRSRLWLLARLTARTLRPFNRGRARAACHAEGIRTRRFRAFSCKHPLKVEDQGFSASNLQNLPQQAFPAGRGGQLFCHLAAAKGIPPKEVGLSPCHGQRRGTVKLDDIAGGLGHRLGGVLLGIAVGDDRGPGPEDLPLQEKLQVLAAPGVEMVRFGEAQDLPGVAAAQDPQGFLVPAPGLRGGEEMRKIRALHQQRVRGEEGRQGPGQSLPIRRPAGVADGNGDDQGLRAIVGDKGQEGLDPMLMGKEGRLGNQRVVEQWATAGRSVVRRPKAVSKSRRVTAKGVRLREKWSGLRMIIRR